MTTSTEVVSSTPSKAALLEMRAIITKRFPGVLALSDVNFTVGQGEVVVLVDGNGKPTLMKIISGVYIADAGEIIYKGKPITLTNPRQAQAAGIATIYQELNQVPQLSITENIFLGSEITRGPRPTGLNLKPTALERTKKAAMFKYYCPGQLCNLKRSCYRD